jgi:hypothetical protein
MKKIISIIMMFICFNVNSQTYICSNRTFCTRNAVTEIWEDCYDIPGECSVSIDKGENLILLFISVENVAAFNVVKIEYNETTKITKYITHENFGSEEYRFIFDPTHYKLAYVFINNRKVMSCSFKVDKILYD